MIQQQTIVKVSDNSGAKKAKCIKILGGFKKKSASVGDTVVVSIKTIRKKLKKYSKVKKGEVYKALVIRTRAKIKYKDGFIYKANENCVSLMNKQNNPLGTRIIGPVSRNLCKKYIKFASISSGFI